MLAGVTTTCVALRCVALRRGDGGVAGRLLTQISKHTTTQVTDDRPLLRRVVSTEKEFGGAPRLGALRRIQFF